MSYLPSCVLLLSLFGASETLGPLLQDTHADKDKESGQCQAQHGSDDRRPNGSADSKSEKSDRNGDSDQKQNHANPKGHDYEGRRPFELFSSTLNYIQWAVGELRRAPFATQIITALTLALFLIALLQFWLNVWFFYIANPPRLKVGFIDYPTLPGINMGVADHIKKKVAAAGTETSFEIINTGGSRATVVQEFIEIIVSHNIDGENKPVWRDVRRKKIAVGKRYTVSLKREWSVEEVDNLALKTLKVYLVGGVRYKDRIRVVRQTGFCQAYTYDAGFYRQDKTNYECEY